MDDAFLLKHPEGADRLWKRLSAEARRDGQTLYGRGAVAETIATIPGEAFTVRMVDGLEQEVTLAGDGARTWYAECTCEEGFECQHVCAALLAILAEHRNAVVRSLSAGLSTPGSVEPLKPPAATLEQQLLTATGRSLTSEEKRFVRELHLLYQRSRQTRSLNAWDLANVGLPLFAFGRGGTDLWPSFPKTEQEFWLYIVHYLQKAGARVPEFMLPISELAPIQDSLRRWERNREIQKWKNTLQNAQFEPSRGPENVAHETDLRLILLEDEMLLEWKPAGSDSFDRIKRKQLGHLEEASEDGSLKLTLEGELLWQLFRQACEYGPLTTLNYDDPEAQKLLNRVLRLRALESRVLNSHWEILPRVGEPLRWVVTPANSEEEDYRFRMMKADGKPAPPFLAVLPGKPTLYLTKRELFFGPAPCDHLLDPSHENLIPAPAMDGPGGVALMSLLGAELPERLRRRVRKLPYQVAITCKLKPSWYSADGEDCYLQVVAEAADGRQQTWVGYNWLDTTPKRGRKENEGDALISVYDSSILTVIPPLLEPLNLKPASTGTELVLRVTRKFPELFAAWIKSLPPEVKLELTGELSSFLQTEVAGQVKLDVAEAEIDWFDLRVVLHVADTTLSAEEVKLLLNAKGRYVRLKGKGWKRLQYDLSEDENEKLARLGLSARELSAEPQRLHALQLADESAKSFLPEEQVEQLQRRAGEIKARVAPDLPGGVTAQLRPYQLEGFHFLAYLAVNRFGGILADDMGLGKTLQTLAWLVWLRQPRPAQGGSNDSKDAPSLVVCPKSVMDNWHAEAARFTPELRVRIWPAAQLSQLTRELQSADLHVLNYSQLRSLGESLVPVRWLAVILDEGQYIKNPSSQTAQVARAVRAEHRLILTGTPIENRLLDLWSLLAFAMPGVLGSRAQFARLYDAKGDPLARRRLASRVRPFVLRRTKSQVARDLPDRIEEDLFCELEGEQLTLYRAELKRAQQLLLRITSQQELARQQFNFLTSLLRLRQICCHPRLVNLESNSPSAKTEALLEQLEPLMDEGQKVLVFSQFVEMLDLLRPGLEEQKWPLFYLTGQTENRGELVQQFQSATGPAIFLISLKAGGFGLNLTAASYVVLFDPWWNPAVENQAIDRTHRIGQTNKVIAYRLLIKNSVEEKIRELQKKKKALAEDVLGEEKFAQSLTVEDLQFLLAD